MKGIQKVYLGSEIKLNIHIDPIGDINMEDYDFEVKVYCTQAKSVIINKEDAIKVDENNYIVLVDTKNVGTGELICKVTAYIPDPHFDDGFRTEIVCVNTKINIVKTL